MDRTLFRIISKAGLVLVLFGFFMPISCNLNAFQIAEYSATQHGLNPLSLSLNVIFTLTCVGIILAIPLLMNKRISIQIDWCILIGIIIPSSYAYLTLKGRTQFGPGSMVGQFFGENSLQHGVYVIFVGLLISVTSLCIASFYRDTGEEAGKQIKNPFSEIIKAGMNHLSDLYRAHEFRTAVHSREFNYSQCSGDTYIVPEALTGAWYKTVSGLSTTLIVSTEKLHIVYSDGKVISATIASSTTDNNPFHTRDEYPSGWAIIAIAQSLRGKHPFNVGQKIRFRFYMNNGKDKLIWYGNPVQNAFKRL